MKLLPLLIAALVPALLTIATAASAAEESKLYSIPLKTIDGKPATLKQYEGKVLLIVNTASECGFTPQYKGLEAIWEKYQGQGLMVLGFPSNDFGGQEPGSEEEIKAFCTDNYKVTFPMFSKLHVKGAEQHPLYAELTGKSSVKPGPVKWNFGKFLIGKDGTLLARFDSDVKPESDTLKTAIESALSSK